MGKFIVAEINGFWLELLGLFSKIGESGFERARVS